MKNILLVEDENISRLFLTQFVGKIFEGINIFEAGNGQEALHKFKENDIDLVVTDIEMPIFDGRDLIKKIREIDSNVPIVVESAYQIEIEEVDEIIVKPLQPAELKKILYKYL